MKKILKFGLIYLILFLYLIVSIFSYAIYIINTGNNEHIIINLIIAAVFYLLVGLLYSNHFHKRGLLIGLLSSFCHIIFLKVILLLMKQDVSFNIYELLINTICGGIGGFLGILFKKIV